jgi:hypothetical protein
MACYHHHHTIHNHHAIYHHATITLFLLQVAHRVVEVVPTSRPRGAAAAAASSSSSSSATPAPFSSPTPPQPFPAANNDNKPRNLTRENSIAGNWGTAAAATGDCDFDAKDNLEMLEASSPSNHHIYIHTPTKTRTYFDVYFQATPIMMWIIHTSGVSCFYTHDYMSVPTKVHYILLAQSNFFSFFFNPSQVDVEESEARAYVPPAWIAPFIDHEVGLVLADVDRSRRKRSIPLVKSPKIF